MLLFLELPDDLVVAIVAKWSVFLDVVKLDASICSSQHRERFCYLTFEKGSVHPEKYQHYEQITWVQDYFLEWALARKAFVAHMVVNKGILNSKRFRKRCLQRLGPKLLSINMEDVSDSAPMIRTLNKLVSMVGSAAERFVPSTSQMNLAERLSPLSRSAVDLLHPWRAALNDVCNFCPQINGIICPPEFDQRAYAKIFSTWPKLTDIVTSSGMNDQIMTILTNSCKKVQRIFLKDEHSVTATGLSIFISCSGSALRSLKGTIQDDTGIGKLCAIVAETCPKLIDFSLRGDLTSIASFRAVTVSCKNLQMLDLQGPSITDEVLDVVAEMTTRLLKLRISWTDEIADTAMAKLVTMCQGLTALEVLYCPGISDMTATAVAENCSHLTDLTLCEVSLTHRGLRAISLRTIPLRKIDLSFTKITDKELIVLMTHHRKLESVCVTGCSLITDSSLVAIGRLCKRIKVLSVSGCKVTTVGIRAVAEGCKMLSTLQATKELIGQAEKEEGMPFPARLVVVESDEEEE